MDLRGQSDATIMTSIPVNDNKQPPNAQYNSSQASGPEAFEFGTNIINPKIDKMMPITNAGTLLTALLVTMDV